MVSIYRILWIAFILICVICIVSARLIDYAFSRAMYKYGPITGRRVGYIPRTKRCGKYIISYTDNNIEHTFTTKFIYKDPNARHASDVCVLVDINGKIYSMYDCGSIEDIFLLISRITSYLFVLFFVIDIFIRVF